MDNKQLREKLSKILGLVEHPEKSIKGLWYKMPLYDEDFEQITGYQYKNAEEYLNKLTALFDSQLKAGKRELLEGLEEEAGLYFHDLYINDNGGVEGESKLAVPLSIIKEKKEEVNRE